MSKRAILGKALAAVVLSASVVGTVGVAVGAGTANAGAPREIGCQAIAQAQRDGDYFGTAAVQEQDWSDARQWYALSSAAKANYDRVCQDA